MFPARGRLPQTLQTFDISTHLSSSTSTPGSARRTSAPVPAAGPRGARHRSSPRRAPTVRGPLPARGPHGRCRPTARTTRRAALPTTHIGRCSARRRSTRSASRSMTVSVLGRASENQRAYTRSRRLAIATQTRRSALARSRYAIVPSTPTSSILRACAIPLAVAKPMRRPVKDPGPRFTQILRNSSRVRPLLSSSASIVGRRHSACRRGSGNARSTARLVPSRRATLPGDSDVSRPRTSMPTYGRRGATAFQPPNGSGSLASGRAGAARRAAWRSRHIWSVSAASVAKARSGRKSW